MIPECNVCGVESVGARFLTFVEGGGMGRHCWVAEFLCPEHSGGFLPLQCSNLSQWRLMTKTGRGIFGVRKLTEDDQNQAVLRQRGLREQRR